MTSRQSMRQGQSIRQQERGEGARAARLSAIRAELLVRIRPLCGTMPDELFLEMVENMAAIQLKYELHGGMGRS